MAAQAPSAVLLIRPHHFRPNPSTALDNAFQTTVTGSVAKAAFDAASGVAVRLRAAGVTVHLFDDDTATHPDSVFCNNWISTHDDGRIAVYPMHAANRRGEQRRDVIEFLRAAYAVTEVLDWSALERDGRCLEGTGAMVLDHVGRVAYVSRSRRADPLLARRVCERLGYEPYLFDAVDADGTPIYHTNVMMCVATQFALVGLTAIRDPLVRADLAERLLRSGREVIALSQRQLREFAGNAIELQAGERRVLALSERAVASLTNEQQRVIERSCTLLPLDVTPIELAGGSVRCMIAGIHLQPGTADVSTVQEPPVLDGAR